MASMACRSCIVVLVAIAVYFIYQRAPSSPKAPKDDAQGFKDLAYKNLGDWTDADVSHWLVKEGFKTSFAESCLQHEVAGEDLVSLVLPTLLPTVLGELGLEVKEQEQLEKAVRKLVRWKGQPPPGFWGYRRLHRWHAEMVGSGLVLLPRGMLLHLKWREGNTTLAFIKAHSRAIPFTSWRPPVEGLEFWLLWLVAPEILTVSHTAPYFNLSYWAMYVFGVLSLNNLRIRIKASLGEYRNADSLSSFIFLSACEFPKTLPLWMAFVVYWWVIWPWTPWFVCSFITRCGLLWFGLLCIAQPFICIWQKHWLSAACQASLAAIPLMFDDRNLRDVAIWSILNVIGLVVVALLRYIVGQMTPDQLRETFGESIATAIIPVPCIRISEQNFLRESITELNKIPVEKLTEKKALSVVYTVGDGTKTQQEGIDAGGLYRDWLNRSAQLLLDESEGAFSKVLVNGVEVLHLRDVGDLDPQRAAFIGRLLGLSLKAEVPLGWRLSEPSARMLLHNQALMPLRPSLASGSKATPASRWQSAKAKLSIKGWTAKQKARRTVTAWTESTWWLAAGFDYKTWVFATHGEGQAMWLLQCSNEKMNLEDRKRMFEEARFGTSFEESSVETLDEDIAKHVKEELLHSAFIETWQALHGVPDVRLSDALALPKARPSDWKHVENAVLGQQNLDIDSWKGFTDILHPPQADTSQVEKWFWEFVKTLTPEKQFNLLFWWTSYRRLPNGGWLRMPARLTLNITSDTTRLPVAHTCSYQIDLPNYKQSDRPSEKLELAMSEFGFRLA